MRLSGLILVLCSLAPALASAQTAHLTGRVLDLDTRRGLPGANVFLSGTVRGSASHADGSYAFTTDLLGQVELVASLIGYSAGTERITLQPGDTLRVDLYLGAIELAMDEVQVEARQSRQWRSDLRRFEELFLGVTANGRRADIENPEILDFATTGSRFTASAQAPLIVLNEALGYRMTLLNLQFQSQGSAWGWQSPIRYEDLPSASSRRVRRARQRAYQGSLRHFLASMVTRSSRENGFLIHPVERPGNWTRSRPLDEEALANLVTADSSSSSWLFVSALPLQITYRREKDPRPGHRGDDQVSWIVLNKVSVRVDARGRPLEARPITRYGYWDWERTADLLPHDYVPEE